VNITYKVLYNDAVAMTGGQQVGERPEGHSVNQIAHSLVAEGVQKLIVVTDEPEKYSSARLPVGVEVKHRDLMDDIQREFREIKGTTAIIYDQTCATEKRRRRKRGTLVDPAKRVVINELVCEGCGDCGVQSNCMSVEPLETEFGRKRTINQSTCNKDFSCVKGFCPSFVTVEGELKKKSKTGKANPFELGALPNPTIATIPSGTAWGIVVAGVGGTGVITIGQLLGMAAHMEGKGIVTQDAAGLAQKGGNTWSHVLLANTQADIATTRVATASADLILGCDPMVAASKETLARMQLGRTHVALNAHGSPTASFVLNGNWQNPSERCAAAIAEAVGAEGIGAFNADAAASKLMGDTLYTNPMMLGFAWQKGWIPLEKASLIRAIELNAVAIDNNKAAFEWGRRAAHDWASVEKLLSPAQTIEFKKKDSLQDMIAKRVEFLTNYQNATYAQEYKAFVDKVMGAENGVRSEFRTTTLSATYHGERNSALTPLSGASGAKLPLTEAVTKYLFKLMAYKDEYEVARLHTDAAFHDKVKAMFEGEVKLSYHLAPPLLSKTNSKGELQKQPYGAWMLSAFKLLAKMKGLRGTAFDIFGKTEERKMERALIAEYRASIDKLLPNLNASNAATALEIARIPEQIKGFGHVKERNVVAARAKWVKLEAEFSSAPLAKAA
ncbi:MAG: indolepyruvate ferredoxin oxidoreductase family protein, partial [Brachymonas sp.]|nr:indolepyruvate ferredoxin oxidoreductase family protein [Brachymonas sp.]